MGEDLQALVTVQHFLFGPLLVALTYLLGRLLAGRLVASWRLALVAISGPLLLYEHYVMTEVPFAILLLALLCATVLAAAARRAWRWPASGRPAVRGAGALPAVGQILAPIVVGVLLLLMPGGWLAAAVHWRVAVLALCALVVVVPWMAYNQRTQGVFAIAGSGRFLLARTLKMDPGGFTFDAPPGAAEDGGEPRRAHRAGGGGPQAAGLGGAAVPRRAWPVRRRGVPADAVASRWRRSAIGRSTS